ncbi:hypothetical protein PYK79_51265 [Streptomyces sp. ID05-04B]|uniref:hypothetical protein n=1 Tax=unclassified Streptomyces TaxID=2593676 RepID=UPI000D1AB8AA|nr:MULTISPECIES: hypothetical protein [unclassified Streptomyces]AVV44499.1 hypothetical protein C6376_26735 [Streptomyces sp. P3]MDX5569997.1 hypothetical protein [Streptomyces sp. ID05-04B]
MRLRLRQFRLRTGPHEHRVVQPWEPSRRISLSAPEPIGALFGDQEGLSRLSGLFSFAACSRHTIVHLPLRDSPQPDEGFGTPVDLVLVHHTLGLRAAKWPALRRKLVRGTPLTADTDESRTARDAARWAERVRRADFSGRVRHATHAGTFFLFGNRDVFAATAMDLAEAAGRGPCQKGVAQGHAALMTALPTLAQAPGGGHDVEVLVLFKPRPPHAHVARPGS